MINKIHLGDCLEVMKDIPTGSIDMILADLPYGTTSLYWDSVIDLGLLWAQYERIIKDNGAMVLTAQQPFTSQLVNSNIKLFRYSLVWEKTVATNFFHSKRQPHKKHEDVLIFYKTQPTYNPQMVKGKPYTDNRSGKTRKQSSHVNNNLNRTDISNKGTRYPSSVQKFSNGNNKNVHPTQKPLPLIEWLVKTYTNVGDTVLDNVIGSGTTAISCMNTNRNFIGIEMDEEYYNIANERIKTHEQQGELF